MGLKERVFFWAFKEQLAQLQKAYGSQVYGGLLENIKGRAAYPPDNVETYIKQGYLFNPAVYSIISFIAQKAGSIPWGVYEVKNDKALRLYKSAGYNFYRQMIKTKALVALPDHDLNELLLHPNQLQGWAEYCEQFVGFKLVTGDAYIQAIGPKGGVNAGSIRELWNIPSQIIKPVAGDRMQVVKGYQYLQETDLIPPEQIIHLKYWTPEYYNGAFLYGLSPLRAGKRIVTKSNASYDASVSSFQNMGAFGIISAGGKNIDQQLTEEQADMIERRFAKKTGPRNWGKPLITSADIKWEQIGMSPVDLNIIESDKMDFRTLCSIYHVPSELFNDADNKTYSNTKEAGSAVYTNAVLPQLDQFRDSFNMYIGKRYPGVYVDYDASMISELQDDLQYMTTALQGAWWLTPNEKRDIMSFGMDEANPLMDEYWIPTGMTTMTDTNVDDMALEEAERNINDEAE